MGGLAKELITAMSEHAQLLFALNGGQFHIPQWVTENAKRQRVWFETPCRAGRNIVDDQAVIAALAAEQRADFKHDHIIAFATAYNATMMQIRWLSVLHHEPERLVDGIVVEAHDRASNWRCHMEIIQDPLRLGPLSPIEPAPPTSPFAGLLPKL